MNTVLRAAFFTLLLAVSGCVPEEDRGGDPPGSVPDVSGVIEGTVLYVGQRPLCDRDADGAISGIRGNVVLLLFFSDNPPPPQGTASSATTFMLVPARELFNESDCLPEQPMATDLTQVVTRSAAFTWPDIPLARHLQNRCDRGNPFFFNGCIDYQVRAFFDRDQDFNPFFSVRRLATRGDVAGGAFVNTAASPPQFARLPFGSHENNPEGQVVSGVAVTLGAIVNTELPASELGAGTQALSAEATIPPIPDPATREQALWDQTQMRLVLIDPSETSWMQTLDAAGMSIGPEFPGEPILESGYAWFTMPVDADRNGMQDLHPILGPAGGVMWEHPIVILRRARNPVELAVGIPDVAIISTVRPTQTLAKDTFDPSVDIIAPPIAAVTLDPNNPACRIPFIAPGNLAETYERIPADCQEVPTGNYDINVLAGIAGGNVIDYRAQLLMDGVPPAAVDALVAARTDNGWVIEGGTFSSQAWSIPNELGCPDPYRPTALDADGNPIAVNQIEADPTTTCGDNYPAVCDASGTSMQCSQGPHGRFSVVDPDATNAPDSSVTTQGHGIASCETAVSGVTLMPRTVAYLDVPEECCGAIAHLCGLPLCDVRPQAVLPGAGDTRDIREIRAGDFTMNEDGTLTPLCVPFLMPASCCD